MSRPGLTKRACISRQLGVRSMNNVFPVTLSMSDFQLMLWCTLAPGLSSSSSSSSSSNSSSSNNNSNRNSSSNYSRGVSNSSISSSSCNSSSGSSNSNSRIQSATRVSLVDLDGW